VQGGAGFRVPDAAAAPEGEVEASVALLQENLVEVVEVAAERVVEAPGREGAARVLEDLDQVADREESGLRREVVVQQAEVELRFVAATVGELVDQLVGVRAANAVGEVVEEEARQVDCRRRFGGRLLTCPGVEGVVVSGLGRQHRFGGGDLAGHGE
jgi:hypothetical protein